MRTSFSERSMSSFDPISALLGGALIGLASALLMMATGRIAGISGILGGCLTLAVGDKVWRFAFVLGLILAPFASGFLGHALSTPRMPDNWIIVVIAGLLVGFGARLGGGCTSGHGVCGIARLSPRSTVATAIFMTTAIGVVFVMRHGFGI
ncbi:MAG: YeeE/YedE family protein [Pseudolabrys sp.]